MLRQVELGLGELGPVGLGLEIEIDRGPRPGDLERQGGLAGLTGSQQGHGRDFVQGGGERREAPAGNHPCNHGITLQKYKVRYGSGILGPKTRAALRRHFALPELSR